MKSNKKFNSLSSIIEESVVAKRSLVKIEPKIKLAIHKVYSKIINGGKVFLCGNGGSAADAQHLAAEFLVRLNPKVNRRPLAALSLSVDTSTLTACGNDYSFDDIFSRNLEALATPKDILIAISTSGNSKNILKVLKTAKKKKIFSIGFLGCGGGQAKKICDLPLLVNSKITARIQEAHIFLGHYIFDCIEKLILKKKE
jgi:D-sedoheptulose 7-phosphate isomerase